MQRKGMGAGRGKGYKNIIPVRDKKVHHDSGRGIKQPQKIPNIIISKEKKFDVVSAIMEYESGEMNDVDTLKFFSHLIKTGQAWTLQGHYGRTATALINDDFLDKKGSLTNKAKEFMANNQDTDGDGVVDSKDCDPNDPMKQDIFKIKDNVEIEAHYEKTRSGFRHIAVLKIGGVEVDRAKATYQNRTWESYEFESVIKDLLDKTDSLTDLEKNQFLNKSNKESKEKVENQFKSVGMVAQLGDILMKGKKEKNDWKKRMLKAGHKGLSFPDNWDSLTETEKEKRLNKVISFYQDGKLSLKNDGGQTPPPQ